MATSSFTLAETAPAPADDAWRTRNLGALLFAATGLCVRDKLGAMRTDGFDGVSEAQLALFHHVDLAGARLTTLAARANLTKQSMIELVDRAEALRLVERRPDPEDGRAKTVHLTAEGLLMLASLGRGIAAAEDRVRRAFGPHCFDETKRKLGNYAATGRDPLPLPGADGLRGSANIARVFAMAARRFSQEALAVARDRSGASIAEVLLTLFRNLDLQGSRLTDMAVRARVTKPSMQELVDRAEALGFVARQPVPADGRARMIVFTAAGLTMLGDVRHGVAVAEERFGRNVGAAFSARLKARLLAYAAATRT
jgi:DNA-binding MarR family transcriptional regulator